MKWITAGDIKNWTTSNQRHCSQTLPELISRLVLATATTVEEINFPNGDSVAHSGWDGVLKTPVASPFFPVGTSVWEIGTGTSPGVKAEDDYVKRTANPLGFTKSDTSFIFVTPKAWPDRVKWQNEKQSKKIWKDVRVIAADGLEQWLALAPAVALWLAREIKELSSDFSDIEGFWEEWSVATDPKMTTDIVLAGRISDMDKIHQWIENSPSILEVRGDSPDEPFAFLYSSIKKLSAKNRLRSLSRCIIVENSNQLKSLARTFQDPLIIVAPSECRDLAGFAVDKGHHVFLSADSKSIDVRNNLLELSRPRREIIEKDLHKLGLSKTNAKSIARDFGVSIPVLRRRLFRSSAKTPIWANKKSALILIPLLLAGAWDENKEGDQTIIKLLSGMKHEDYVKLLEPFLSMEDSPIRKIGSVWMLKSQLDAWFMLAPHIIDKHLKVFKKTILSVLTKTDPKYDLEEDKRWMASIYGKSNLTSEWVQTGFVESLIIMAIYSDRSTVITSQVFVDSVVKEILLSSNTWEFWSSIKDVTPLLAEASPNIFIETIEGIISKNPILFQKLMSGDASLFSECKHSGILWALESLAWSPNFFAGSVSVLLKLSQIDKGGRWSNRPIGSLKNIFIPHLPQTYATPEQRLDMIDKLAKKDASIVWEFARAYYSGGTISESYKFKWRESGGDRQGLEPESRALQTTYINGLFPKLDNIACVKENLIPSIEEFISLPTGLQKNILSALEKKNIKFTKDEKTKLLTSIRYSLHWINSYGEDKHRKNLPALSSVYKKFTPKDILEKHDWLLSNPWPELPQGESKKYDEKDIARRSAQKKAAREVLDKVSLKKIITYANTLQQIIFFGSTLGKAIRNASEDAKILDAMVKDIKRYSPLIQGYAFGRVEIKGVSWVEKQISRMKSKKNYSPEICAALHLGLKEGIDTWNKIKSHGKKAENTYWKHASSYSDGNKEKEAPVAVEKLLSAGRPDTALRIAGDPKASIPSILLQRLLQDLLVMEKNKLRGGVMYEYHLGHVFKQLYKQNDLPLEELIKLEWPYAAFFKDFKRYTDLPTALHRLLQKDPSFFAQVVSFIYKRDKNAPKGDVEKISNEIKETRARVAYEVLGSWHLLPGIKDDGSIDEKKLIEWLDVARKKCSDLYCVIGGDIRIGSMLAHSPSEVGGVWPHVSVRNAIEHLNNKIIDEHISTEIYNSRGVVTRKIGGGQERDLAKKYQEMSDEMQVKWPRTSALLRSLCKTYENQAKREDVDSDLNDLRY